MYPSVSSQVKKLKEGAISCWVGKCVCLCFNFGCQEYQTVSYLEDFLSVLRHGGPYRELTSPNQNNVAFGRPLPVLPAYLWRHSGFAENAQWWLVASFLLKGRSVYLSSQCGVVPVMSCTFVYLAATCLLYDTSLDCLQNSWGGWDYKVLQQSSVTSFVSLLSWTCSSTSLLWIYKGKQNLMFWRRKNLYFQLLPPLDGEVSTDFLLHFHLLHPESRDSFTLICLNICPPPWHLKIGSLFLYPAKQQQLTHVVSACVCHSTILSGSLMLPERRNIKNLSEGNLAQSKCLLRQFSGDQILVWLHFFI